MKVVIVGAGEVGLNTAERLSREGHDVTIIERDPEKENLVRSKVNALVLGGSGASADILKEANVDEADLFIAVTDLDEVNLVACMLANEYHVPRMIARIRSLEYTQSEWKANAARLGIDLLINPDNVVAEEICRIVSYPAATDVAEFAGGRVLFLGYPVGKDSPLVEVSLRTLGDLRGVYRLVVTALTRKSGTIVPRGDDKIEEGDIVYFVCNRRDLPAVNHLFGFGKRKARSIFVLGAGRVGSRVARILASHGYRPKVIDHNQEHCERLARDLDHVVVINADGTDIDTLKSEGIDECDAFIAVTQDEQSNILCSLLAKSHGARRAIALVDKQQFVALAPALGVDACFSPRLTSASAILKYVRKAEVVSMAVVEGCDAEVMELSLPEEGECLEKPLKKISVPMGAIIGAIFREDEVIIPSGDDDLRPGDRVIVFALPDAVAKVEDFFS